MNAIVRADAFHLPFQDRSFDIVVCDPPYKGKTRGKKGVGYAASGYIPFTGRTWWHEAWRVLRPSGHLYVVAPIRELGVWHTFAPDAIIDVIAWVAPNTISMSAFWKRGVGGRGITWRPIIHWQREPRTLIKWGLPSNWEHPLTDIPLRNTDVFVDPNVCIAPLVLRNMQEAEQWPNQLPLKLVRYLLRPHAGDSRVLDLFSGSGTARVAAIGLGMNVVSVDLSPEALRLAERRPAQTPLLVTL